MKIGIISLGCSKNLVDSEAILGVLAINGIEITNQLSEADAVIINTCGFIQSAKEEAIQTILEVYETKKKGAKLIVTGCLVERYKEVLGDLLQEVDLFIPLSQYNHFSEHLSALLSSSTYIDPSFPLDFKKRYLVSPYHAYVKIGDGCNNRCNYCAIPLIRGNYYSRDIQEIVNEVKTIVINGISEITLISQDTSRYGSDFNPKLSLVDLLKEILTIPDLHIIRVLYLYPSDVSDQLIELIKNNPVIAPYFDIPIQHCSNKMLKAMNRRGSKEDIIKLITKIRKEIPLSTLRTTLITGFPGESEEDYQELLRFIQEYPFDRLGVFCYCKEEDTPAYSFPNQVPLQIALNRQEELMKVQEKVTHQQNKKYIGVTTLAIIYEENDSFFLARGYMNAPDNIDGSIIIKKSGNYKVGDLVALKITSVYIHDLYGEIND